MLKFLSWYSLHRRRFFTYPDCIWQELRIASLKISWLQFKFDWNFTDLTPIDNTAVLLHECHSAWWRHQMETFYALLVICAGNSQVPGEFPTQRPVTRGFDVFFDLRPNKRLSKQSWGWWFETPSRPLWRHYKGPKSPGFVQRLVKANNTVIT